MLSFMRCANVVTPSGGPKDIVPPVVLQAIPENQSTNFQDKEIHITFDEYVTALLTSASNRATSLSTSAIGTKGFPCV